MPRLLLLLAPTIVAGMIAHASAQNRSELGHAPWTAQGISPRDAALLKCFADAPWVDNGTRAQCLGKIK